MRRESRHTRIISLSLFVRLAFLVSSRAHVQLAGPPLPDSHIAASSPAWNAQRPSEDETRTRRQSRSKSQSSEANVTDPRQQSETLQKRFANVPISPSDLPWWGWLLCAFAAACVASFLVKAADVTVDETAQNGVGCVAMVVGLIAAGCALIGVIRLVKWVWTS
jgi:hypothetical protein